MSFTLQQSKLCNIKFHSAKNVTVVPIVGNSLKRRTATLAPRRPPLNCTKSSAGSSNGSELSTKPVMDIEQIMQILPHRYPFLLVDRVLELENEKRIVGYKNVTVNDQFFNGHFPERRIMPGVLQVEAMAQLAGILILGSGDKDKKQNFFFGGIENCRFKKPVVPGDTLMMKVSITKLNKKFGIIKAHGEAYTDDEIACEADMTLVLAKS